MPAKKKSSPSSTKKSPSCSSPQNPAIRIIGARQHNLKNLSLDIPTGQLTVITGPSGSGKSSLAFHTLYAEGQRRYVETFSPYVRQFLDRMDKPIVDRIENIPPAIAVEQKNQIRTTRSTVGTLTELNDYLKVIFPLIAQAYDPETGEEIKPDTPSSIAAWAYDQLAGESILVTFPILIPQNASPQEVFTFLHSQGYLRIFHEGQVLRTDDPPPASLSQLPPHTHIIQDRIKLTAANRSRLHEALEAALHLGKGTLTLIPPTPYSLGKSHFEFSTHWVNPTTGFKLQPPSASLFSFNSPLGACPACRGFGRVIGIDLKKAIHDPTLSLQQGVIKPFESDRGAECKSDLIRCALDKGISITSPWHELSNDEQAWVLRGEKGDPDKLWKAGKWYGVKGFFDWMESKSYKMHVRVFLSRYRAYTECPDCDGSRLKPEALCFKINGKSLPELWQLPIHELSEFFDHLQSTVSEQKSSSKSLQHALTEVTSRLSYLNDVGLSYLTLDRPARTLSGGEIERVNLTTCLGASLTNTLFVLDEPTVGLHPRDIHRLIRVMHSLRDKGNTVVVVEHEESVMLHADNLIDIGPLAGEHGGQITFHGSLKGIHHPTFDPQASPTLPYLLGHKSAARPRTTSASKQKSTKFLKITGASRHNIHALDVAIPLRSFTCITGVSGSGKSTLANDIIYLNLLDRFHLPHDEEAAFVKSLTGHDQLSGVERVDQSPLTRTPRSTPAVYSGAFDAIRELFTLSPEALTNKLPSGYFSFNSGYGRCQRCLGNGYEKVEMQFLSDLFITCPDCDGSRYSLAALEFQYDGKSIAEVLACTVTEALAFFSPKASDKQKVLRLKAKITTALTPLIRVGLGYLRLGQPLNTLSGGESQRLKLCLLLSNSSKSNDIFGKLLILDEPTTGLHFTDIENLLDVFQSLTDQGHTLLVIEHNLDVIRSAEHLIELGPGAGVHGGQIVFTGTPHELLATETETAKALHAEAIPASTRTSIPAAKSNTNQAITLTGAREHNLKNFDLTIPRNELVVITGLSGSGKSTLAFDIIFAEGQRRFLDSMSPYARQFAGQLEKPDIDKIEGLPPTVAIEQRVSRGGGKSTVGTITEIYHFLRLLYAKLGTQHCPESGLPVVSQTTQSIFDKLQKSFSKKNPSLFLVAPLIRGRKGYHTDIAEAAAQKGFTQLIVDEKLTATADFTPLARFKEHDIFAVITTTSPTADELDLALKTGKNQCAIAYFKGESLQLETFSTARVSPTTGQSFPELDPHHFSFNSPRGWCLTCRGYGSVAATKSKKKSKRKANEFNSEAEAEIIEELQYSSQDSDIPRTTCPDCLGDRIQRNARFVLIEDHNIAHVSQLPVTKAVDLLESWSFAGRDKIIARDILPEITQRLRFLEKVGLNYLSLDRSADTLSGGESQRIRLAAQLGSNLTGVLYVLDEPTIGLHPRDNVQLLETLESLKNKGNSLLIVEHDEETMQRATRLIDLGPGAGIHGGQVTFNGKLPAAAELKSNSNTPSPSSTINALAAPITHPTRGERRTIPPVKKSSAWLSLSHCSHNNLKDIDVHIPLSRLTVITGVSGCGKSSLMRGTLPGAHQLAHAKAAAAKKLKSQITNFKSSSGFELLKYCYEVDQTPIGKTSRSCPATYVKILDEIRKLYAQLPEARMRGYTPSRFSFNNADGQCPECKGNGRIKLEMDFLPTTLVPCESCHGNRYNQPTLEILYNGNTISDVLNMNITTAADFFKNHTKLHRPLDLLDQTGLGYLTLGQPSPTLSGGEAQRLKLVAELTKGRTNIRKNTQSHNLYLIEEPTIGLHQDDVKKLIDVLHRLTDEGHTVIVIEHHTAIMAEADYLIDMGPEAGQNGGSIVAQGTPEVVAKSKKSITAPYLAKQLINGR